MKLIRNLGISVASLVLFLLIGEGVARMAGVVPRKPRAPMFSWAERGELYTMTPGEQWVMPGNLKLVRVNSLGLRGPEIRPKGDWKRVLLLGDSVAFGYDVVEKRALPARLQREVFERGMPVEIVGAAVPGWCARQHRLFLREHGAELTPDLIVATVVLNDIPELQEGQGELASSVRVANVVNVLAARSALATWVRKLLQSSDDPFNRADAIQRLTREPDSGYARAAVGAELEEIAQFEATARELGASLALVVLPFRFQLDEPPTGPVEPQATILAFARERGIPALDLLPTLREIPPREAFLDQVHLTELGHEVVARRVGEWLLAQDLLEGGAASRPSGRGPESASAS